MAAIDSMESKNEIEITCEGSYSKTIHIDNPQLWWPRGYGEQNLYTVSVDLVKDDGTVVDNWTRKIGLRTITMDRTKDKWVRDLPPA